MIENRAIEKEMKSSYLDYAMSVILSRAIPDVKDGLKPVQRRILYSMYVLGLSVPSSESSPILLFRVMSFISPLNLIIP